MKAFHSTTKGIVNLSSYEYLLPNILYAFVDSYDTEIIGIVFTTSYKFSLSSIVHNTIIMIPDHIQGVSFGFEIHPLNITTFKAYPEHYLKTFTHFSSKSEMMKWKLKL